MFVLHSYAWAVVFCIITMFCWGSWANTQKLAKKGWRFELFYWDYTIGVLLLTLILGLTLGSNGTSGRPFLADLTQVSHSSLYSARLGGAIFIWPTFFWSRRLILQACRSRFRWASVSHWFS